MLLSQLTYTLPKELIANVPISPRDHSSLMVINRKTGKISHHKFFELPDILTPNDVLVFNKTKVYPARLFAVKASGGKIEILFIEEVKPNIWEVLTKPGLKTGQFATLQGTTLQGIKNTNYVSLVKTNLDKVAMLKFLQKYGRTPLPPYIKSHDKESKLRKKYQTIYAQNVGSVAAPTAGFHFTKKLLNRLKEKGVQLEYVTLHVGLGTFLPIKEENIENHKMHSEYFDIDSNTLMRLNEAKSLGKRIIAVGTTPNRVLETPADENGLLTTHNPQPTTNLFIYPPYKFRFTDALITNFHLPHSTLLALVSAFVSYPNTSDKFTDFNSSLAGKAYKEAIRRKYRFYSFGDSSLIT